MNLLGLSARGKPMQAKEPSEIYYLFTFYIIYAGIFVLFFICPMLDHNIDVLFYVQSNLCNMITSNNFFDKHPLWTH